MANYGFAIDLRKCIGCHACTIACKAEHDIPVGANRCWVKTVEKGTFPDTRRFFFPVLCNQCDEAPCARICPTRALFKRRDGIVDLNGDSCIGCRACMVACPYDQLFIDPNTHTAEKCNFCANRLENELLPACVSVCPTGCRIFGDLDDAASDVARIARSEAVTVRKPEKGTQPKIFYIAAEESVIQPEAATRPFMFKEGQVLLRPLGALEPDPARPGDPRVDYDVPHRQPWGADMAAYLLTKGVSTGAMLLTAVLWLLGVRTPLTTMVAPAISLVFVTLTAAVLVYDLERPERFYYILARPNWRSWMVWGAYFMTAHGLGTFAWLVLGFLGFESALTALAVPVALVAILTTGYTGFLFAQGLARDLWQGPHAVFDLLAQAIAEGAAAMLVALALVPALRSAPGVSHGGAPLAIALTLAVAVHLAFVVVEQLVMPSPTRHHELATNAIVRGAFRVPFWAGAVTAGGVLPLALVSLAGLITSLQTPALAALVAALTLTGSFAWEYVWVEAGQSVPLS